MVSAGETEAAAAIGVFRYPHDVLGRLVRDQLAHGGIASVGIILAAHRARRRYIRENRGDAFHPGAEAHVEIPFIVRRKRLHAACDGVYGQCFEIPIPVWIHGPIDFESAANPIEPLRLTFFLGRLDRVVERTQTRPSFDLATQRREVLATEGRVFRPAIAIDHDRIGVFEDGIIVHCLPVDLLGRPTAVVNEDFDPGKPCEAFLKQQTTGAMLVRTGAVAGLARNEHDFLIGRQGAERPHADRYQGEGLE